MTTSEPTTVTHSTKQIIDWLRYYGTEVDVIAADRLESQEREIVGLTELNKAEYVLYKSEIDAYRIASESLKLTILRYMDMTQTLTARAEQAERERDAAIAVIEQNVAWQKELLEKAKEITDSLRGLPQDGEGL